MSSGAFPPLEVITDDNHGPYVIITAYTLMFLTIIFVMVRLAARYRISNYTIRLDDFFISLAVVLLIIQSVCVQLASDRGLGQHRASVDDETFEYFSKYNYASQILLIGALACAKVSVVLLLVGIKPQRPVVYACYALLAIIGAWTIASVVALGLQCGHNRPWDFTAGRCMDQAAMYYSIGVFNILTDIAIVVLPTIAMLKVQVSQANRWLVISLFAVRLIVCVAAIIQLAQLPSFFRSQDRTWDYVNPSIWTQVMLNLSLITACIPSIKHVLSNFQTGLTAFTIPDVYELGEFNKSGSNQRSMQGSGNRPGYTRGDGSGYASNHRGARANVFAGPRNVNSQYNTGKRTSEEEEEKSESVKGLTEDTILQTVDFRIDYGPKPDTALSDSP